MMSPVGRPTARVLERLKPEHLSDLFPYTKKGPDRLRGPTPVSKGTVGGLARAGGPQLLKLLGPVAQLIGLSD